jgi:hypothetical protein
MAPKSFLSRVMCLWNSVLLPRSISFASRSCRERGLIRYLNMTGLPGEGLEMRPCILQPELESQATKPGGILIARQLTGDFFLHSLKQFR